jgi:PAS domain S-box-containing protein
MSTRRKPIRRRLPPPAGTTAARPASSKTQHLAELYHDLQVHQEEVRIQNQQLIESQRLLEDSRNRYVDLYDFAPIAIITLCEAGVIREANLTASSLIGSSRASLLETPFITLVAPSHRRMFLDHLRRCRHSRGPVTTDLDLRTRDGRIVPISLSSNSGTGWPNHARPGLRYHSAIVDLTEHRAAQQAREQLRQVAQSEQLVRTVIDALPVGVRVIDPAGNMVIQNSASERIWGGQMQGIAWHGGRANRLEDGRPLTPQDWPLARALAGKAMLAELIELRPDNEPRNQRIVKQAAVPLVDANGTILGAVAVSEDVTELWHTQTELRRAKREADVASRLKDDFLAMISHELRTPLSAVLLWSHLLRTGKQGDVAGQHEAIEAIYLNARAQSQIIDDLLDLSRMTTGKFSIQLKPVELTPMVREAVDSLQPAAAAKGIKLDLQLLHDPGKTRLDADRMRQVVWNLLSNAIKFTPQGGWVRVSLDKSRDMARLTVADTGQGIAPDFLPHVFDRFRQADGGTTRLHGGLGLGLSIVKQLVEMHGGTVQAASLGEGKGATFTVELPLPENSRFKTTNPPIPDAPAAGNKAAGPQTPLKGTRVLLVEDEPLTRRAIARLLEQSGARVTSCESVPAALAALEKDPPDVLLSDLSMPGEDGLTLIRKVRQREAEADHERKRSPEPQKPSRHRRRESTSDSAGPGAQGPNGADRPHVRSGHLPAAALTARAMPNDRQAALEAGFEAYIPKPVDAAQLVDLVKDLVIGNHTD